ncbi:response regulator transcription factor [Cuneatibacter sp. NSJ-177]|uniref:response regulator transcription factor n=1 Tax=Cuneatibacter sp. NSJ-177 TaxID=2931401 RepID=UPI001FD4F303|nr:response regulator transcription factor [Cuneatibacter sp. NSJ-177]MCJ7836653.1 response regulator transcription factor [Cuneatibacter sp. NSJ-177]
MIKIVVVEDDVYLREEIMLTFQRKGYSVSGISSFAAAEEEILRLAPDLVLLDVNLPRKSGFELCKWLKSRASFPILILTARDTLIDELTALGLGADDFLTKPCHPDRLVARARRLLQTYGKIKNVIQAGSLALDTDTYKLVWQNASLILPETEGKILRILMERHPMTVSRREIFTFVWGTDEFVDENILPVNMTRLRKSLSEIGLGEIVKTIRGQGYCLKGEEI